MNDKPAYIIVTEFSTSDLINSVNALMDEYEPQGGPFYSARLTGKIHSLIVAQAMVKRSVTTVESTEQQFARETGVLLRFNMQTGYPIREYSLDNGLTWSDECPEVLNETQN